jgi:hypothetical protein
MTATPGCAWSHWATVAARRSGRRATGCRRARARRTGPSHGRVRSAPSSPPRPGGRATEGIGTRRRRRRRGRRLMATPTPRRRRTPAAPPQARALCGRPGQRRTVRRAQGATTPGRRAVTRRRGQRPWTPPNCRTRRGPTTPPWAHGRSARGRVSRRWRRRLGTWQTGQGASVAVDCPRRLTGALAVASCHVSRGRRGAGGSRRDTRSIRPASCERAAPYAVSRLLL